MVTTALDALFVFELAWRHRKDLRRCSHMKQISTAELLFLADFEVVARRTLGEQVNLRIFRLFILGELPLEQCRRMIGLQTGEFLNAVYTIQVLLGKAYRETGILGEIMNRIGMVWSDGPISCRLGMYLDGKYIGTRALVSKASGHWIAYDYNQLNINESGPVIIPGKFNTPADAKRAVELVLVKG